MDYNGKWILLWKRYIAAMQVLIKILCMIKFLNFLYRPCQTHNTTALPRESTKQPRDSLDPGLQEWYCLPTLHCRQPPNPLPGTWKFRVCARSNFSLAPFANWTFYLISKRRPRVGCISAKHVCTLGQFLCCFHFSKKDEVCTLNNIIV